MKTLIVMSLVLSATSLWAGNLQSDFLCEAKIKTGETIQVSIRDIDFAKEVTLNLGNKACSFGLTETSYSDRSAVSVMGLNFKKYQECEVSKKFKTAADGFIRLDFLKARTEAHVVILVAHQSLECSIKMINERKLKDRIGRRH